MADAAPLTPEEIGKLPHDDRGLAILLSHWLLTAAATVFLGLRVYCKRSSRKKLWWDDWILIAAWSTILATDIITTALVVEFKLGRHSWDLGVTPDNLAKFIILLSARASFTLTSLGWTKTAFAVTLLRLTEGFTRSFVWFIIISLNVTTIVSGLVPWIQCSPLEKTWNPALDGTCWAPKVGTKVWIGMGAYSALMDFTLAALPWTFLYHLALRNKEKFGILVAMSMGVIAGGVAIAKCAKLPQLGSGDSFNEVELYIWDITESTVTAMAACIPALRVLLRKHTSTRGSNSNSGGSGISGSSSHKYVHSISNVASPHSAITGSRPHIFHNDDLDTDHPDEFEFKTIPTFRTNITTASPTGPTAEDQRRDYESRFRRATREGLGHAGRNTDRGRQQQQPRGHEQQQQAGYFDLPPQPQPEPQRQSARPSPAGSSDPVLSGLRTRYEYPSSSSNETPTQVKNLD